MATAVPAASAAAARAPDDHRRAAEIHAGHLNPERSTAPVRLAQASASDPAPQTVGKPPAEDDRPSAIAGTLDVGGVLTPQGMLVVEPSFTYSHSGENRFTFRGTEIVETVLLGVVEAEDQDRDFFETALTLRYGITDWLEVEARVPGVYRRDETVSSENIGGQDVDVIDTLDSAGLGDVEVAGHLQLNQGGGGWPYFVANFRAKFPTGTGPFDVDRDADGIETELPTGSGFYALEPSLTAIYPSDPVVMFANVGYLWTVKHSVDEAIRDDFVVGRVNPGDSIRFGFGMSFAVNEEMSFSISYAHDVIEGTTTQINDVWTEAEELTVGQVTIGFSHRLSQRVSVDLGTTFGVTEDASDVTLGLRLPIRFQLF